ncbi:4-(cytidine 5'-diphospho)-2-C-methyl-D-erythritol kinase [Heliorestis acidaminivorans]|uniref:4-diphosphocytidyl-2-C-methyl-D-erythritol kinase n=1 Tax=Heliorestis acidaminivorans TaxID=553427 RepID=A0A6I0EUP0_9FIRM|nr:4-(cytidine 5'-diphospho)-2-C-methyl-D-erythritol kinase [Heliorestis acidaminivorans]KAB2953023.1 4-(cytidine 5'-diphospho)-2-C-methyl-D-erythritol kinase [Heliorestis acidaminivorans]
MGSILQKLAPAKINLSLDVLGRRSDGYHQVEMIMQTIDLFDKVSVRRRDDDSFCLYGGNDEAPPEASNLVYKTALLVKQIKGQQSGLDIFLDKKIPVAAGLAGGSSDAAAMMKLLNKLWNLNCSAQEMELLLAKLGSDIPFLVQGGTALATGRGEILQALPAAPAFWVILIKPSFGVSTPKVYQALQAPLWVEQSHTASGAIRGAHTVAMLKALEQGSYSAMIAALGNELEKVTIEWHPQLEEYKQYLLDQGCDQALMSGSGPTIMGFVQQEKKAREIASSIAEKVTSQGCNIFVARSLVKEEEKNWNVDSYPSS